ncbi:polynucleotidyl transferase, ribonuclease H-like superfamily protein [Actinidia rufa]|uniref:Polynucleotidyl transferase, ribonuclease H-like superfamily protein n=1 Tax=Actinidia rufa TaxID=165716 RepID=A0A7J0FYD8_9ERIC|nr:polynucleotidyl transferase, ribonuclease H-like superfamily protein [Actinidia rufa]
MVSVGERKLEVLQSYSTLVRPADLSVIATLSVRPNGISKDAVVSSPTFAQIADTVYELLHGRIWAGHNIVRFDCARIREAFAEIHRPPPEPKGTIDSLALLTRRFGRRAGNMKMATLATYFGIGRQTHRSLDDLRMNLEVLKYCATVLFLESGLEAPESSAAAGSESSSGYAGFLEPDEVSIPSISVVLVPFYRGTQRIQILHKDITLQLCCTHLKVRFGMNRKFVDYAGRPRLNFVVDTTPNLCQILDACDRLGQRLSVDSGSSSEWLPLVNRKDGSWNSPTMRLQIPTVADESNFRWVTELYEQESSATPRRLVFSKFDVEELVALFTPGTFVDAYLSLDPYDYQQNAGIRLVAKKLILHSN